MPNKITRRAHDYNVFASTSAIGSINATALEDKRMSSVPAGTVHDCT